METKLLLFIAFLTFSSFQPNEIKLPVYINKFKTEVSDGMYINCLTINDLGVIMPVTEEMKKYDIFKLELHRFGDDSDILAASKTFIPGSKNFKKYINKESVKLNVLAEESDFGGSDLEPNTIIFPANSTVNSAFCKSHDLKYCSFYLIVRGYKKTGEKTQFGEDIIDSGIDLSSKSVVFKSWQDKTIRESK
jgi:hypothetical protein